MSTLPDLTIRQLEYLVAVDEASTWAVAAADVGVSASALSQGLAELERRVGVTLFESVGRRRVVRPEAAPVVAHARQVLGLTRDLVRWSQRVAAGTSGVVRVGMIDASAVIHHPDVLRDFHRERPDVDVRVTVAPSSALLDQLVAGDLDLAACVEPPEPRPGVATRPLLTERLCVYGPSGRRRTDPATWGPWMLFPSGSHTRAATERALHERGAVVEVTAESHQPDVLREMVRMGLGWTVLPEVQAEQGERALRGGVPLTTREIVLATRDGAVTDPAAEILADLLVAHSA